MGTVCLPSRTGLLTAFPLAVIGPIEMFAVFLIHKSRLPLHAIQALPLHTWKPWRFSLGLAPGYPKGRKHTLCVQTLTERGSAASVGVKTGLLALSALPGFPP